jgi:hypothetical protein
MDRAGLGDGGESYAGNRVPGVERFSVSVA